MDWWCTGYLLQITLMSSPEEQCGLMKSCPEIVWRESIGAGCTKDLERESRRKQLSNEWVKDRGSCDTICMFPGNQPGARSIDASSAHAGVFVRSMDGTDTYAWGIHKYYSIKKSANLLCLISGMNFPAHITLMHVDCQVLPKACAVFLYSKVVFYEEETGRNNRAQF